MGQSNVNQPLGLLLSQFKTARHPSIERHLEVEKVAILDSLDAARVIVLHPKPFPAMGSYTAGSARAARQAAACCRSGVLPATRRESELTNRINPPKVMISHAKPRNIFFFLILEG